MKNLQFLAAAGVLGLLFSASPLAAADEGAPLGPAGGPFGVPDRQAGGQQPDRDGQPHLGGHQVPEELADRDAGAGRAAPGLSTLTDADGGCETLRLPAFC